MSRRPRTRALRHPGSRTRACGRELPTKQRTALALRYVADAGYDEISAVMGTSEDAARRNVHEALKRLRTEYEQ
jgi:DNA-directed RNA polymerase specialized sigma24 family protein